MNKRIWELDALRGLCVIGMVIIHFIFDLTEIYGFFYWDYPALYSFVQNWGGVLFLLISGICVTLGRHSVKRGLIVFCCGLLVTAVTYGMTFFGFDASIIIYFGVLHCLGICMLLWPLFKRLPVWLIGIFGSIMVCVGLFVVTGLGTSSNWLIPFGIVPMDFASSDYFPLLPHLGFFLLGAVLGKTVYAKKQSLLPRVNGGNPILRFFCFCGKHSLWIYLLHQPALYGICMLLDVILR